MVLLSSHHRVSKRHPVIKSQHFGFIVLISVLILALLLLSGCKRSVTTPQASQGTPSGQGSDSGTTSGSNSGSGTGSGGGSGSGSGSGTGSGGGTGTGSTSGTGSGKSSGSGTSVSSEYSFAVYLDGTKLKDFTLKDVLALPQTSVTADGKEQKGPKLKEVLKAAGITEYSKVKVSGAWQETYTLDKSAVDDTVVLDTANRGTCKLAGPSIPKDKWVRDVTRIEVTR